MNQDTPENDLKLLRKAVVEIFERAGLSLPYWQDEAHLLHGENGPIGRTIKTKHARQIEQAFYSVGKRMP